MEEKCVVVDSCIRQTVALNQYTKPRIKLLTVSNVGTSTLLLLSSDETHEVKPGLFREVPV